MMRISDDITVELKMLSSRSVENVPGFNVRSCEWPRVIIDVPY